MGWSWWVAPVSTAFGAVLALVGVLIGLRQRERTARRAEWRQRLAIALDRVADATDAARASMGRYLLSSLATSDLATDEERHLAATMLSLLSTESGDADEAEQGAHDLDTRSDRWDNETHDAAGGAR